MKWLQETKVTVPDGELGIFIKKEENLGIVIFASLERPCKIEELIGARLMAIDKITVNDLEPWMVAEIIKMKKNKILTVIKNSIPVAREILTAPIVFNANFVII